jgi:hypothetical protein
VTRLEFGLKNVYEPPTPTPHSVRTRGLSPPARPLPFSLAIAGSTQTTHKSTNSMLINPRFIILQNINLKKHLNNSSKDRVFIKINQNIC